jgi:hypothetical protein
MMRRSTLVDLIRIALLLTFIVVTFLVFQALFETEGMPTFAINIVTSVLGSVITIALMMLLLQAQMRSEQEKDFRGRLFERKLDLYREFLEMVFKVDDDNLITKDELQDIENKVGELSLVASADLIGVCSTFLVQLKSYGVMYTRSMLPKQIEHFEQHMGPISSFVTLDMLVQAIRRDLSVVEGDVQATIERFVGIQYDRFHMIKDPNVID